MWRLKRKEVPAVQVSKILPTCSLHYIWHDLHICDLTNSEVSGQKFEDTTQVLLVCIQNGGTKHAPGCMNSRPEPIGGEGGCYWDKKAMDLTPCLGELGHKKNDRQGRSLRFHVCWHPLTQFPYPLLQSVVLVIPLLPPANANAGGNKWIIRREGNVFTRVCTSTGGVVPSHPQGSIPKDCTPPGLYLPPPTTGPYNKENGPKRTVRILPECILVEICNMFAFAG